jgi:hypothetical protein
MAKVKFDDGTVINFDGEPSQQDISDAYSREQLKKSIGGGTASPLAQDNINPPLRNEADPSMVFNPRTRKMEFANAAEEARWKKDLTQESKGEKLGVDTEASKKTSSYNLDLVAQNVYDLGNLMTKSWDEGGAGNALKKVGTQLASKGVVIGDPMTYKSSAAIIGKRVEFVSKMMPMLTQQIGKEGSVRLVESIFNKLGQTIPDESTPPELAREQMYQSLLSAYRTRRALEQMDLSGIKDMSKGEFDSFAADVANRTNAIEMTGEEQKSFENMASKALAPIDKYYAKKGMNDMLRSFKTEKEAEAANLPKGSVILIGGSPMEVE